MSAKKMLLVGAICGALSVSLGAFGAHGLKNFLQDRGQTLKLVDKEFDDWRVKRLGDWEIASRYLMYHALAVFGCGLLAHTRPSRALNIATWLFIAGTLLFSGFLYALVLTEIKQFGMIPVPMGGVLLICGWISLAYAGGGYCSAECRKSAA